MESKSSEKDNTHIYIYTPQGTSFKTLGEIERARGNQQSINLYYLGNDTRLAVINRCMVT